MPHDQTDLERIAQKQKKAAEAAASAPLSAEERSARALEVIAGCFAALLDRVSHDQRQAEKPTA